MFPVPVFFITALVMLPVTTDDPVLHSWPHCQERKASTNMEAHTYKRKVLSYSLHW